MFDALASLAGVVALLLAAKAYKVGIRAYRVSEQAYRVSRESHRKAAELNVLRDLEMLYRESLTDQQETYVQPIPLLGEDIALKLMLIPADELPLWRLVSTWERAVDATAATDIFRFPSVAAQIPEARIRADPVEGRINIWYAMGLELHEAMKRRTE
ncbi:hypothetical protein ACQPYV_30905 [Micromonospora saelicesensis]|uniref:hypothetical protein n=1 Tax=Micromonospora saelicesensis TaxID=285676 RepID=UPI0011BEB295|nr:hypothetical protein [Micromonospora saelicesensis]